MKIKNCLKADVFDFFTYNWSRFDNKQLQFTHLWTLKVRGLIKK